MNKKNLSKRLVDVVIKSNNINVGTFGNIYNDLGESTISYDTPLLLMSYAYARRTAAAGLFLQGIFNKNMFDYVQQIFKSFQINTIHTIEFQIQAAKESDILLQSYDSRLTKDVNTFIVSMVCNNLTPEIYDGSSYLPYETVLTATINALLMNNN